MPSLHLITSSKSDGGGGGMDGGWLNKFILKCSSSNMIMYKSKSSCLNLFQERVWRRVSGPEVLDKKNLYLLLFIYLKAF